MIRSMTGYAREEHQAEWGRLTFELRSVNHRYLDVSFRLPEEFRALENELRQQASQCLGRGKLEVQLRCQLLGSGGGRIELDVERLRQLRDAINQVEATLGTAAAPDPVRVLGWPGVACVQPPDLGPMHAAARETFARALTALQVTRAAEGERLADFIRERLAALHASSERVRDRYPQVRDAWLDKLRERCAELGVEVDPGRLEQEAVLVAQRLDVEEELSRLAGHIDEVRQVLEREEPVGRRLDFLMQELNREANTLGSKSQDGDMTRETVEMKVLIEQMREQVQNIE